MYTAYNCTTGVLIICLSLYQLRSKPPPPQPAPKPVIQSEGTPPWLAETKLKRSSRPPRGEVEKLSKETEPEKPAWMKDAMAKKKRASLLLDKSKNRESGQKEVK